MGLKNTAKRTLVAIATALAVGCSGMQKKSDYPSAMLPVNLTTAYFGSLATHEGAHAGAAALSGGKHIRVNILPGVSNRVFYFGYTNFECDKLTKTQETFITIAGPASTLITGISVNEWLKSGYLPKELQPTLGWYALANKVSTYYQCVRGLARSPYSDLGKENIGWTFGMLGLQLGYDIFDGLTDNKRVLDILIGKDFYEPNKRFKVTLETDAENSSIGMFAKIQF